MPGRSRYGGADAVVFDPDVLTDTATYDVPKSYPAGIEYVLVHGQIAVVNTAPAGVVAGRALS